MTGDRATPTTLRGLAELLGCKHSALHKAVIRGRLTAGVGFDADGRIVVSDARVAVRQWKEIHVPTTLEMIRRASKAKRAVDDRDRVEEIDEWDALDFLAATLVGAAVASEGAGSFRKRIRAQLLSAVRRHWGNDDMLEIAEKLLAKMIDDPIPVEDES